MQNRAAKSGWVRLRIAAWLCVLAGCAAGNASVRPTRPTRSVMVAMEGSGAQLVGEELARDGAGNVEVALHDGRRMWIAGTRVRSASFAEGEWVALRADAGEAVAFAEVVAQNGALLRVRRVADRSELLVSPASVLAVARVRPDAPPMTAVPAAPPVAAVAVAPAPAQPPADPLAAFPRVPPVVVAEENVWSIARAVRCERGSVVVLFTDGATASVPEAELRAPSGAVGTRVAARYTGGPLHYFGELVQLDAEHTTVRYEDGSEERLAFEHIGLVFGEPGRAPAKVCGQLRGLQLPRVLVRRYRAQHAARIEACTADALTVRRGDASSSERMNRAGAAALSAAVGDRIVVRWNDGLRYLATIRAVTGDQVHIVYEDGSEGTRRISEILTRMIPFDAARFTPAPVRCE